MTQPVISLRADATRAEAAAVLAEHRISGSPVIEAGSRVLGIVSEKDFLALILLAVALVVNNLHKGRKYPELWF